jgi:hypothetical protein
MDQQFNITPMEPLNQDWKFVVLPRDFLLEQQVGMNIFKPHIKLYFMSKREMNIPTMESPIIDQGS